MRPRSPMSCASLPRHVRRHLHRLRNLSSPAHVIALSVACVTLGLVFLVARLPSFVLCSKSSMGACVLLRSGVWSGSTKMSIYNGESETKPNLTSPVSAKIVKRDMFPKDFIFGTATAAYQVEGAFNEGGRGLSIWDVFSRIPGKTVNGDTGDVACDQYHRYESDILLMKDLGVDAYRFSISWPRILPDGKGKVNSEGVAYYNRLIDGLLKQGIQPYVTLYHWDLPQKLEDEFDGWLSEEIVELFAAYAETCFSEFGDRVKHWITFNEPLTFSLVGYSFGAHAPGRCSDRSRCPKGHSSVEPYIVGHNILKSHAAAAHVYRQKYQPTQKGSIGITLDSEWPEPLTDSPSDKEASQRHLLFHLGWMLDPIFKGDYPTVMREQVKDRLPKFTSREKELLANSVDFVGINHYTSRWVTNGTPPSDLKYSVMLDDQWINSYSEKNGNPIGIRAASEWLFIVPWGLEKLLLWVKERYDNPPVFITENGMDDKDDPNRTLEQLLEDNTRVSYFNDYLLSVARALHKGANIQGYFLWSFMDNFEWAMGYSCRFGVHFVDYKNGLKRYPKKSAKWWSKFLRGLDFPMDSAIPPPKNQ